MTYDKALAYFGTAKVLAGKLGVTESLIYSWKSDGFVPEKHVIQVHLHSHGEVPIKPEDYRRVGQQY